MFSQEKKLSVFSVEQIKIVVTILLEQYRKKRRLF